MTTVYITMTLLIVWNFSSYLWALVTSAPNVGDGYNPTLHNMDGTNMTTNGTDN